LDNEKWLKGTALDFQPMESVKGWHKTSPDLTPGSRLFQRWGEAGLVTFLSTGLGPSGKPADPPMPMYKMTQEDAEAVVIQPRAGSVRVVCLANLGSARALT
jgi:hypothetical protein